MNLNSKSHRPDKHLAGGETSSRIMVIFFSHLFFYHNQEMSHGKVITTGRAGGLKTPPGWGQNVFVIVRRARARERKRLPC